MCGTGRVVDPLYLTVTRCKLLAIRFTDTENILLQTHFNNVKQKR